MFGKPWQYFLGQLSFHRNHMVSLNVQNHYLFLWLDTKSSKYIRISGDVKETNQYLLWYLAQMLSWISEIVEVFAT